MEASTSVIPILISLQNNLDFALEVPPPGFLKSFTPWQESRRKLKPEYLPHSVSLGPDGMYCIISERECKYNFKLDSKGSLSALAEHLETANKAKSTAGLVGSSPLGILRTIRLSITCRLSHSAHITPLSLKCHGAIKTLGRPIIFC
jgi:hypothetical protein